mmetsp:Transcript_30289/g.76321  ORF Transcript_30289/g.76321 Transcript_30289/m.76321 type:complete len:229 (-) Transcript_30289:224-910(-)
MRLAAAAPERVRAIVAPPDKLSNHYNAAAAASKLLVVVHIAAQMCDRALEVRRHAGSAAADEAHHGRRCRQPRQAPPEAGWQCRGAPECVILHPQRPGPEGAAACRGGEGDGHPPGRYSGQGGRSARGGQLHPKQASACQNAGHCVAKQTQADGGGTPGGAEFGGVARAPGVCRVVRRRQGEKHAGDESHGGKESAPHAALRRALLLQRLHQLFLLLHPQQILLHHLE